MSFTPWMNSSDLINSIKRKIAFPIAQGTFSNRDILAFANEEMFIAEVPSILVYHEEYFVFPVVVPLVNGQSRYSIPNRAIGLKMRDLFYQDDSGNLFEMTRISSEDKAYWQAGLGSNSIGRFYIEGNDIVLSPTVTGDVTGSLVFYIYLRPNQLVDVTRACTAQYFTKTITVTGAVSGNSISVGGVTLVAGTDFAIAGSDAGTASNLAAVLVSRGLVPIATNGSPGTNIITVKYLSLALSIVSASGSLVVQAGQGIQFDQVPATYLDPDTNLTSDLYVDGVQVDFLQTKPGHRTFGYDVTVPTGGIAGNIITFSPGSVPANFLIGDYICLANECIIPQIPPDLHNGLAERTCARILASLGDQAGMQATMQKVAEIEQRQGALLDNRAEGSCKKISGRHGLLRYGKQGKWRF